MKTKIISNRNHPTVVIKITSILNQQTNEWNDCDDIFLRSDESYAGVEEVLRSTDNDDVFLDRVEFVEMKEQGLVVIKSYSKKLLRHIAICKAELITSDFGIIKKTEEDKTTYILFGKDACDVYSELQDVSIFSSVEHIINQFTDDNICYDVAKFTKGEDDILDLLGKYEGWEGYTEITEFEYNKLLKNL